jgi:hypothetical protein
VHPWLRTRPHDTKPRSTSATPSCNLRPTPIHSRWVVAGAIPTVSSASHIRATPHRPPRPSSFRRPAPRMHQPQPIPFPPNLVRVRLVGRRYVPGVVAAIGSGGFLMEESLGGGPDLSGGRGPSGFDVEDHAAVGQQQFAVHDQGAQAVQAAPDPGVQPPGAGRAAGWRAGGFRAAVGGIACCGGVTA